jgi:hypothetical protein
MRDTKAASVESIVSKLDPNRKAIVEALRRLMKKKLPGVVEQVKWGNIVYTYKDKNLTWFIIYDDHVNLGFFMGAKLKSKRMEGTGKGLRHIKLYKPADIDGKEFARLISDAVKLV